MYATSCLGKGHLHDIRDKHRDFVVLCRNLLHKAQKRHETGYSSLLNLLLEHKVPEKWWKVGWQRFLDHALAIGDRQAIESYICDARIEANRLQHEIPMLRHHWDECRDGLNVYSKKLRPDLGAGRSSSKQEDDGGGGGHGLINFGSRWTIPLSKTCSTVLRGWHLIGTRINQVVYDRVRYICCTIDLRWVWSS